MEFCCVSSYPGGGPSGGEKRSDRPFAEDVALLDEGMASPSIGGGREGRVGDIGTGRWIGGGGAEDAITPPPSPPISSYAGSCSRSTSARSTVRPLSLAVSAACASVSFIRSYVDEKSKAPPSLKVNFNFT